MTIEDRLIEILKENRGRGIYADKLAKLLRIDEADLRKFIRRARMRLPTGRKIYGEQCRFLKGLGRVTRWWLVRDFMTAKPEQVELFERKKA